MKPRYAIALLIVVCVAGMIFGLTRLLHWRLERGDVYPASSSLRLDPLGARALAESLDTLPSVTMDRNYRHWRRAEFPDDATLYVLRANSELLFDRHEGPNPLLDFMARGGRVVITQVDFDAAYRRWLEEQEEEVDEQDGDLEEPAEDVEETDSEDESESEEFLVLWEADLDEGHFSGDTANLVADFNAPGSVSWKGDDFFSAYHEDWEVVYENKNGPVVLWQAYGEGEVILLASSYLLSNEALMLDRESGFLNWLHGDSTHAIFDEWHFGLHEPSGVMILMKRYRLGGLALGLALLTALFVWRNMYSLTPVREAENRMSAGVVRLSGSSHTGLRNLLKRSIAPADLLSVCVEQFAKLAPQMQTKSGWEEAMAEIRNELNAYKETPPRKRRPVKTYRTIAAILTKHHIHLR